MFLNPKSCTFWHLSWMCVVLEILPFWKARTLYPGIVWLLMSLFHSQPKSNWTLLCLSKSCPVHMPLRPQPVICEEPTPSHIHTHRLLGPTLVQPLLSSGSVLICLGSASMCRGWEIVISWGAWVNEDRASRFPLSNTVFFAAFGLMSKSSYCVYFV